MTNPLAGQPLPKEQLVNVARLLDAYVNQVPNSELAEQRVSFGTSGHRGSSFHTSFNEYHVLAITQAICDYRSQADIRGPIFVGRDTHALSEPAQHSALEVLVANGVTVMVAARNDYTPTPAVSHAILSYNQGRSSGLADGIVITPPIIRRIMAALNTTHPTAARPIATSLTGFKIAPTNYWPPACVR